MSTVVLLYTSVNVIVPVGLMPAESTAESFSITPAATEILFGCAEEALRVTELGLGEVEI